MSHRRPGTSLMEMLVVMAVLSVVMALAATTISRIVRSEQSGIRELSSAMVADRLERQFRSDVHSARQVLVGDMTGMKPAELELSLVDGSTVTWSHVDEGLRRREANGQPQSSRVETYRLAGDHVRFSVENVGPARRQTRLVSVRLLSGSSPPVGSPDGSRRLTISGILGFRLRHHRVEGDRTTRKESR